VPQPIHRWLTDLEHTACGQRQTPGRRRPLVVRGWQDVTCQRCLGSIHWKLALLQRQQPGSQEAPQGHRRRGPDDARQRAAAIMPFPARRSSQGHTQR
jgi:hypothetical protein